MDLDPRRLAGSRNLVGRSLVEQLLRDGEVGQPLFLPPLVGFSALVQHLPPRDATWMFLEQ